MSVIIPTYDYERFLKNSIDSVLHQTWRDIEIIVVDDGSTDGTRKIAESYGKSVTYIYQQNKGVTAAMNNGAKRAKVEFICFLSSDDMYMPEIIARQLSVFNDNPQVELVYTDYYYVNGQGQILETMKCPFFENFEDRILWMFRYCYFMHDTVMFRRTLLEKVGFWDEDMHYAGEYWMWFKCLKDSKVAHIPLPLVKYRIHGAQLTTHTKQVRRYRRETLRRARKLYGLTWAIKSWFLTSRIFGAYWLIQGLLFSDRYYGLYWAKHSLGLGEGILGKYLQLKGLKKGISEKKEKEKLTMTERLCLFAFSTVNRVRSVLAGAEGAQ